jgi:hypothetical protein
MPPNYAEFERYWERMIDEIVVAHPTAKYGVGYVTKGYPCPQGVPAALWRSRPVNWLWDHLPMRLRYNKFAQAGYARA